MITPPVNSREEMLNILAHQVREWDRGLIEVISYPNPLSLRPTR